MELKLAWAVKAGSAERVLELWNGCSRVCGFVDIEDIDVLEEALNISSHVMLNKDGEPINDSGETFDEVERRHEEEMFDLPDEDEVAEKDEAIERLNDVIDEAVDSIAKIKKQHKEAMTSEDEFGESLESNLDHVANELYNAKEY